MASWRRRGGPLLARLDSVEVAVLLSLLDELAQVGPGDADDAVVARLYPAGYRDDPDSAREFRDLTESALAAERQERYRECRAELAEGGGVSVLADAAERWLQVLNDMRLALGTRLGVTADGFADGTDAADRAHPDYAARATYYWLTAVQDDLIEHMS